MSRRNSDVQLEEQKRIASEDLEKAKELIESKKLDKKKENGLGMTYVESFAMRGSWEALKNILNAGYDINKKNEDSKYSLLSIAVESNQTNLVEMLLKWPGINIHMKNDQGQNPLHIAAHEGNKEAIVLLLKHGADIEGKDGKGRTPLAIAIFGNHLDVVKTLVDKGADIHRRNSKGQTYLSELFQIRPSVDIKMVKLLVELGINVNINDNTGFGISKYSTINPNDSTLYTDKIKAKAKELKQELQSETDEKKISQLVLNQNIGVINASGIALDSLMSGKIVILKVLNDCGLLQLNQPVVNGLTLLEKAKQLSKSIAILPKAKSRKEAATFIVENSKISPSDFLTKEEKAKEEKAKEEKAEDQLQKNSVVIHPTPSPSAPHSRRNSQSSQTRE